MNYAAVRLASGMMQDLDELVVEVIEQRRGRRALYVIGDTSEVNTNAIRMSDQTVRHYSYLLYHINYDKFGK